ncbi:DsbA family protein [Pseudooceanicola aestuarii]|uniref:DsbA family protein n=1 Tax=Pseudooceanicola aestuarii TaxID=2697319 RepID=UPI0013D7B445|nr:DsbA family protein [Pseudooceanicola aestuarii]
MDRRTLLGGGTAAAAALLAAGGIYFGTTPRPVLAQAETGGDVDTSTINEMVLGDENAPVTMVEYASFTCPHCATFHQNVFKDLKADYIDTGKVRFIYRDVYFDRFGLWAALMARCDDGARFFGLADVIYAKQKEWLNGDSPAEIADNLRRIGKVAGMEDDTIEACLADQDKARTLVAWFQENAEEDDVTATPTLFVNGTKHSNMSYADLRDVLDAELNG